MLSGAKTLKRSPLQMSVALASFLPASYVELVPGKLPSGLAC